ncbi:hypothetical protein PQJ75_19910 [Rhodoplanes sp. TEM]|uniref:Uncharacterized protein n=1 Tax=Rhodoplanes tepidamans TaxID=200616 RepID=A0ABT5JCL7_RHOTP|nr:MULTISPECIES: hypothetical protein [Rhodoplanes]MDC7786800.1 hypothetical protein [Rhodoplanes tepidamans]MDC7986000.1 hypothetical protein [Rhodoplanes sp. TEM]MDQ0355927.1 hypothetical protein [Rhodoplanes tepidamans]
MQPFVSLAVNIPTGQSALFGTAANTRMDPDLVALSSYGEGWNIGPTLGANVPLGEHLVFTASVGVTRRGKFDRESPLTPADPSLPPAATQSATTLDPGDVGTVTAALAWRDPRWSASLLGSISEETETVQNGVTLYRAGRRYLVAATLGHVWQGGFGATTVTAAFAHALRNEVLFLGASALVTEPASTNSDVYRIGLQHLVPVGPLWLGPTGSFLYRDDNSYDSVTLQFVPAKQRWTAGGIAYLAASDSVTINARMEHVWVHENARDALDGKVFSVLANDFVAGSAVPVVSSRGWQIALGINAKF